MKKKILFIFMLCLLVLSSVVFAADDSYEFNLTYEGKIIVNEPKDGKVTLTGTDGTPYAKVRVKSEHISGPATATIYAYDESGNKFDITQTGAWGPTEGFAIGGTFTNETRITAVYPQAGTYVSRLSLIDLTNDTVITSKEFTVTVYEKEAEQQPNNVVENNAITEIPNAGISLWVYLLVIVAIAIAAWAVIYFVKNKKD